MIRIINIALALFLLAAPAYAGEYKNAEFLDAIKIDDGAAVSGKVWTATDSVGNGGWAVLPPAALANNTLDQAYDEGGAGAGRSITVDTGAVQLIGSNAADETLEITASAAGGALFVENTSTGDSVRVNDIAADTSPFVIDDDGQVGILTAIPSQALHITGSLRMVDGNQAVGRVMTSAADGTGDWQALPVVAGNTLDQAYDEGGFGSGRTVTVDAGAVQLTGSNVADETLEVTTSAAGGALFVENTSTGDSVRVNDIAADPSPFVIDDDGNVGVLTAVPTQALHITGSLRMVDGNQASGNVMISSADGTGVWTAPAAAGVDGTGTATRGARWFDADTIENSGLIDTSDAVAITIDSSENVRIGTGAPAFKLDVVGDINTTTELKIGSTTAVQRNVDNNVILGDPANTLGVLNTELTLLGDDITFGASDNDSIAIGAGANITGDNQIVLGSDSSPISFMYLGRGSISATPFDAGLLATGGAGTNIAGASLIIGGGIATGNAVGGSILFRTSDPGASGSGQQFLSEKLKVATDGTLTINQVYAMPTADGNADEVMSTDGAGVVSFSPELQAANFVAAYDTTTQAISVANTFQTVDFSNNAQLNGWTHTVSTDAFTCNQTGLYLVNLQLHGEKSSGAAATFESRLTINNVEIAGSQDGADIIANNESFIVGVQNFLVSVTSAQVLRVEIASSTTNYSVTPGPAPGSSTAQTAARLSVVRIN